MIVRSYQDGFAVSDWTQELNIIPNQWGTIGQLGIFDEQSVAEHTVIFEEISRDGALIVDRIRGDKNNAGKDFSRKVHSFNVPHFPLDDMILPQDLQGKRAYGDPGSAENLGAVRMRKMLRLRQNHAWTLEYARATALTTGNVYAPNGTVSQNWFTEFGITQQVTDFTLGTSTTDIIGSIEAVIAHIQDTLNSGGTITGVVGLCSPEFFQKLIAHPKISTAYQYYTSTQEPLRLRLQQDLSSYNMHREFFHGGVQFIEMRDTYAGNRLIPANDCYFLPTGTDAFRTYYSPANRFGLVNTLGEQVYYFEWASPNGSKIEIESESNFVNAILRPAVVVRGTTSN